MDDLPCQDDVKFREARAQKAVRIPTTFHQMICIRQQQYPADETDNCQNRGHRLVCVIAFAKGTDEHASNVMPCFEKDVDDKGEARPDFPEKH